MDLARTAFTGALLYALTLGSADATDPSTLFSSAQIPLYQDSSGTGQLGSITPGTGLTVVGEANGGARDQVTVEGWSPQNAVTTLFQAPGVRILLARLGSAATTSRTVIERTKDSYGTDWEHVKLSGWVPASEVVPDILVVWAQAEQLLNAHCSNCHTLYQPTQMAPNAWPGTLQSMAQQANLDPAQVALLTKYMQVHALEKSSSPPMENRQ